MKIFVFNKDHLRIDFCESPLTLEDNCENDLGAFINNKVVVNWNIRM